eukprot:3375663-Pyramimonas_sp.AAC.2
MDAYDALQVAISAPDVLRMTTAELATSMMELRVRKELVGELNSRVMRWLDKGLPAGRAGHDVLRQSVPGTLASGANN